MIAAAASTQATTDAGAAPDADGAAPEAAGPPAPADTWQLDFCSRPMLDERGKKVWELLVCDETGAVQHAEYFANNKVNSANLKSALQRVADEANGGVMPTKVRFFRTQMNTIISRALKDLGIKPVPSRRCAELISWLDERYDTVYSVHPGFQANAPPLMAPEQGPLEDLPQELAGSQWAFVELELGELIEESKSVRGGSLFGDTIDVEAVADELGLDMNASVPGVVALSRRAAAVAAWTCGLEVVALQADDSRATLVMEAGVSTRYRYATWPRNDAAADKEARDWADAKAEVGGLHFLALQADVDDEDVLGFWALRDIAMPRA